MPEPKDIYNYEIIAEFDNVLLIAIGNEINTIYNVIAPALAPKSKTLDKLFKNDYHTYFSEKITAVRKDIDCEILKRVYSGNIKL